MKKKNVKKNKIKMKKMLKNEKKVKKMKKNCSKKLHFDEDEMMK